MRRKLLFVSTMTLMIMTTSLLVTPALAQGLLDKECPSCHGTGKVSCDNCDGTSDIACTNCDGAGSSICTNCDSTGNIVCTNCDGTAAVTCDKCDGSGTITTVVDCPTCYGTGEIEPSIVLKDMNGWKTLVGFDWTARVEGTFHNEEDTGTYGKTTSKVTTLTETYYHTSSRTYFPPHEDVTITIDTPEIEFLEDWMYTIYISSVDDITCPDCDGSGAKSVIATCPDCNGVRTVDCPECDGTGNIDCPNCDGTGNIGCLDCDGMGNIDCPNCNGIGTVTCPLCNGSGYVNDPTKLWIVSVFAIIVIVVIGASAYVLVRRKKPTPEMNPETRTE